MKPPGLTIGQLAGHAGVTVRAVRHYHRLGLLGEPARDSSGYRRYDAQAVIDLIRIKTLAGAGVPLSRIQDLLSAGPGDFAAAIADIDKALAKKIRDLSRHRRRLAELTGGERLFLPPEIVDILGQLRAVGVSERTVQIERDAWIVAVATSPDRAHEWASQKQSAMADPEFRQLYLACDEAFGWDPADPRMEKLVTWMAAWSAKNHPDVAEPPASLSPAMALLTSQVASASPAWRRLSERRREQAGDQRQARLTP